MSKSVEELHQELLDNVTDDYQKTEGFPTWDFLKAFAFGLKKLWDKVFDVERQLNVDYLVGDDLERFVNQRKGVSRKEANKANGEIKIVTGQGTIHAGDMFSTEGGVKFVATQEVVVSAGSLVPIEAVEAGSAGNVPANTIKEMPITLAGIAEVTNPAPTIDGFDAETDESLRARYYDELRVPVTSGNVFHYRKWAREVSGVGDAKVFSLWQGDNTVQVVIIDDLGKPANAELVARVQEYIDPNASGTGEGQAPIGAYCTVSAAQSLNITVTATLTVRGGYDRTNIINVIKERINDYLIGIGFNSNFVSLAKIGDIILNVDGVDDYENLKVNGSTGKVTIPDKSVAVLQSVVFS